MRRPPDEAGLTTGMLGDCSEAAGVQAPVKIGVTEAGGLIADSRVGDGALP